MQPSFPLDSRQDKTYSLRNSINCTQPRSIGQSSAQSLLLSVMLPAGETVAHARADWYTEKIQHIDDSLTAKMG